MGKILICSTAPRRHIQEAGPKSHQGDQEVRYPVNGTGNPETSTAAAAEKLTG